jgi:hypothetical protein
LSYSNEAYIPLKHGARGRIFFLRKSGSFSFEPNNNIFSVSFIILKHFSCSSTILAKKEERRKEGRKERREGGREGGSNWCSIRREGEREGEI